MKTIDWFFHPTELMGAISLPDFQKLRVPSSHWSWFSHFAIYLSRFKAFLTFYKMFSSLSQEWSTHIMLAINQIVVLSGMGIAYEILWWVGRGSYSPLHWKSYTEVPTHIANSWDWSQNSMPQIQLSEDLFPSHAVPSTPMTVEEIDLSASLNLASLAQSSK